MAKRKNGEGTWGKKKIGKYDYHYYRDSNGNYTYGKTVKEVNEKLKAKKDKQFILNDKTTFGEYISNWLLTKKKNIEPTTYDCYEIMIREQILNYKDFNLSDTQLHNINRDVFQKYLDSLANNYSRATIQKIWVIIKQCISYAEINEDIKPNSTKLVKLPIESNVKNKKKEIPFLSMDDANKLYEISKLTFSNGEYVYGNNSKAIILIMYTGMRVSEMVALKWKNVDLVNKTITIDESSAEIINRDKKDNKKYISYDKKTKTVDSNRTIPLPSRAIEAIQYFESINPKHKNNDYVCVSKNKTKIDRRGVNKTLKAMAKKANCSIQDFTVHSLRHTYGSLLLANGVDIKIVSELLGHSDITVTYNIYIGILDEDKRKDVEKVFN